MKTLAPWILALSVCLTSCTSGPYAQRDTAIGALGGAAAGGIIGRSVGGAAVGAGLGALGGNLIGGQRDQRNRQY
jgi:5'-3' exoribonuclease 2